MAEDAGERATATRRDCLAGAAALVLASGSGAPAAAAAPASSGAPPMREIPGGCTPFRRVYLQK